MFDSVFVLTAWIARVNFSVDYVVYKFMVVPVVLDFRFEGGYCKLFARGGFLDVVLFLCLGWGYQVGFLLVLCFGFCFML